MSNCCGPKEAETYMIYREGADAMEILMIRSLLDSAGISVWVSNENMSSMYGGAIAANVMIREGDKWRADQVMHAARAAGAEASEKEAAMDLGDMIDCPSCHANQVVNYVGPVPIWGGLSKTRAFPGSPWRKCLQCEGFFRTDSDRIMGKMPLALMWGLTLAGGVWGIITLINLLKAIF